MTIHIQIVNSLIHTIYQIVGILQNQWIIFCIMNRHGTQKGVNQNGTVSYQTL